MSEDLGVVQSDLMISFWFSGGHGQPTHLFKISDAESSILSFGTDASDGTGWNLNGQEVTLTMAAGDVAFINMLISDG